MKSPIAEHITIYQRMEWITHLKNDVFEWQLFDVSEKLKLLNWIDGYFIIINI